MGSIKALPRTLRSVELENNCPLAEAVSEILQFHARKKRSIIKKE